MPFRFNPMTGNFDLVGDGTGGGLTEAEVRSMILEMINNIATTNRDHLGNLMFTYDPVTCKYVEMAPIPVTDENGNIVVADPEAEE